MSEATKVIQAMCEAALAKIKEMEEESGQPESVKKETATKPKKAATAKTTATPNERRMTQRSTSRCCQKVAASLFFILFDLVGDVFLDIVDFLHAFLETLDAFAHAAHQLGNLRATKQQQHDESDNQDFLATKSKE